MTCLKVVTSNILANLGSSNHDSLNNKMLPIKIIFLTTMLLGNVIWLSYNGALLSELINHEIVKVSLELLLN